MHCCVCKICFANMLLVYYLIFWLIRSFKGLNYHSASLNSVLTTELGSWLRRAQRFSLHLFFLSVILNRTKCSNTQKNSCWSDWDPWHTIIKMAFIKEESEDMKIEETFRVKHEDTETQTKMCLLKRSVKTWRLKKHSESNMKILRHKQRWCLLKRRVKTWR